MEQADQSVVDSADPSVAKPLWTVVCGVGDCKAIIKGTDGKSLSDAAWHHRIGVHHPDLYARLGHK